MVSLTWSLWHGLSDMVPLTWLNSGFQAYTFWNWTRPFRFVAAQCTMGRGGMETKVNKGTCYWVWNLWDKILACMKKDPSCFRKHPEQCFLRPDLKIFLEFQKKIWFAISVNLKMTIQNYFFVKKVCKKKSPIKFVGNFLSRKEHIRAHPNEYEIYVEKYFLVWKKTRAATANNRNNVF